MKYWWIRIFGKFHVFVYIITNGYLMNRWGKIRFLILLHTGRKSKKIRKTPLLYLPLNGGYVVVASYAGNANHPDWFLNLCKNPIAEIIVGSIKKSVDATIITGDMRPDIWSKLVSLYSGYNTYQSRTDREIPLVFLKPIKH